MATNVTPIQVSLLGTTSILVAPASGTGTLLLATTPAPAPWNAQSNADWLHVSAGSASGTGNATIYFTYDANSGSALRSGTLTVAGQTVTVAQPSAGYHGTVASIPFPGSFGSQSVAVDTHGATYFSEQTTEFLGLPGQTGPPGPGVVKWNLSNGQFAAVRLPAGTPPRAWRWTNQGNVYIAETAGNAIAEWNPSTGQLTTLISSGLNRPSGVAVDAQGNVYIADYPAGAVMEWS